MILRCVKYFVRSNCLENIYLFNALNVQSILKTSYIQIIEKLSQWTKIIFKNDTIYDENNFKQSFIMFKKVIENNYSVVAIKVIKQESGKLSIYKSFKSVYQYEIYLHICNYQIRRAITKLRIFQ